MPSPLPEPSPLGRRIADFLDRYRLPVAVLLVAFSAFSALGLLRETPPRSLESRLDPDAYALLESTAEDFRLTESNLFLVVRADDLFSAASLADLRRIQDALRELPEVEEVLGLDRVPVVQGLSVSFPLLPPDGASNAQRTRARELASRHPLVADQLLSPEGNLLVVPILVRPEDATNETADLVRERLTETARDTHLDVRLTGLLAIFVESERIFAEERVFFMAAGFVLAAVFAMLLFRSFAAVVVAGVAPGIGVLWTLGTLRWMDEGRHDMASIVMPILLMMIGFTDGIHLIVHVRKARNAGLSPREAAKSALANLGSACMWTSLTTAVGFGSLMVAGSTYASEFGRACAIGVVLTFFAVVTVIPLLSGLPFARNIHHGWRRDPVEFLVARVEGLVDFCLRHARTMTVLGLLATFGLLWVGLQLRPTARFAVNMPDGSKPYEALTLVDREMGGIQYARVVISWPEGAEDETILRATEEVEALIERNPEFRGVLSVRDLLSVLPGGASSLASAALLPEDLRRAFLNLDRRRALVSMRVSDQGFGHYEPLYAALEEALAEMEQGYAGFGFRLTGDPVFYGRNLATITLDLVKSLGLAAGIILVVMWAVFRSWRTGIVSIFPNVFPLAMTAALLYLVEGGGLELASVCSFTVCLGIAVDDTIHFLTRFKREWRRTPDLELAIHRAVRGVGAALVTTTIVLVVGFGVVLTSQIPVNRLFAGMGCTTIGAALLGDLILLPAMLKVAYGSGRPDPAA